jgi:hypothetical protein
VRLEPRGIASAPLDVIDRQIQAIAVDWISSRCEGSEVGAGEEPKGRLEERMQGVVFVAERGGVMIIGRDYSPGR